MAPLLLDHLFVLLVLVLIFPFGGWWAYQRFLARLARDGEAALVREYRITLLWLLGLGLGTLAIWSIADRPLEALGLARIKRGEDFGLLVGISAGALGSLLLRPIVASVSSKAAAALRKQFGALDAFLPKTRKQLFWGLAVSLFAGIFEEIAYRGYLISYLSHWLNDWAAIGGSALLFGFAHFYQGKLGVVATTALGAAFGWIFVETGSLLLPILLHCAVDISAMVTAWIVLRNRSAS